MQTEQKAMKNPQTAFPWDDLSPLGAQILLNLSSSFPFDAEELGNEFETAPTLIRSEIAVLRRAKWPIRGTNKSGWLLQFNADSRLHKRMRDLLDNWFETIYGP